MRYLASYDVESVRCLEGVRAIAAHHLRRGVPATFFVVGELLEDRAWAEDFKAVASDSLFEVQNHSHSHLRLKFGREADEAFLALLDGELERTNDLIGTYFGVKPLGFRTPMGFAEGLRGERGILNALWRNGLRYVSSQVVGEFDTVPAPFRAPFFYEAEDILRPLLELPAHGWHDNVLKGYNYCPVKWPPIFPFGYPAGAPRDAREEFAVWKSCFDYARALDLPCFAPIFHPWSVRRFDPEAGTIGMILDCLQEQKVEACTYTRMYRLAAADMPV